MKDRVVLHCDCNSFFASVEMALDPTLKDVPIAVCGDEENRHGIVLAKNELAKKFGIITAETVYSAKRKCPGLIVVKPHYHEYQKYSEAVNKIYSRYTDMIEPFGIDESWLDVTASGIFGSGYEIAEKIREDVKREIGITVSIGVSFNKVFAKLGSDYKKPDAITVIDRNNYKHIAYPLPVGNLLFVGKRTVEQLSLLGIKTIGDLAHANVSFLISKFGKMGKVLHEYANGDENCPVDQSINGESKSIANGLTFKHDLRDRESSKTAINFLCEEIGSKLRKRNKICATVQLTIKDEFFKNIQRQRSLETPTDLSNVIAETAFKILCEEWLDGKPIRTLTVSVSGLISKENYVSQVSFFDEDGGVHKKDELREEAIDKIRDKFGSFAILKANVLDNDMGIDIGKKNDY